MKAETLFRINLFYLPNRTPKSGTTFSREGSVYYYNLSTFRMNIYINVQVLGGERFDYVVVSTGHYSVPNVPTFQEHF